MVKLILAVAVATILFAVVPGNTANEGNAVQTTCCCGSESSSGLTGVLNGLTTSLLLLTLILLCALFGYMCSSVSGMNCADCGDGTGNIGQLLDVGGGLDGLLGLNGLLVILKICGVNTAGITTVDEALAALKIALPGWGD